MAISDGRSRIRDGASPAESAGETNSIRWRRGEWKQATEKNSYEPQRRNDTPRRDATGEENKGEESLGGSKTSGPEGRRNDALSARRLLGVLTDRRHCRARRRSAKTKTQVAPIQKDHAAGGGDGKSTTGIITAGKEERRGISSVCIKGVGGRKIKKDEES